MAKSLKAIKALDISDLNKMTKKQIQEYLKPAAKIVNERVNRFAEKGLSSPASRYMEQRGKIKTTGTRAQLIKELAEARRFLMSETGTIKGAQQYITNMKKTLGISRTKMTKEELSTLWGLIDQVKENMAGIGSDVIQKITARIFIQSRGKQPSRAEKEELLQQMRGSRKLKSISDYLTPEDLSNGKYVVFKAMLEIDNEYQRTQRPAGFFRIT